MFNEKLEDLLSTHEQDKILLVKSCANWLLDNEPETLFLLEKELIGDFRIHKHVATASFSVSEPYKMLFRYWIEWLRDKQKSKLCQERADLLEKALEDPQILSTSPYLFVGGMERIGDIVMTYSEDKFLLRFFSETTPTLPAKIKHYNEMHMFENAARPTGVIAGIDTVRPCLHNEEKLGLQMQIGREVPFDYKPLDKLDVLRTAKKHGLEFQELNPKEKMIWIMSMNNLPPADEDVPIMPSEFSMEMDEINARTQQDPSFISKITSSFVNYSLLRGVENVPASKVEIFLSKLYDETKLDKIQPMISFYEEIAAAIIQRIRNKMGFRQGGLPVCYVSAEKKPEEVYEYFGDLTMQTVRRRFVEDDDRITRAFFGWLGRELMKKYVPETKFSFAEHEEIDKREKTNYRKSLLGVRRQLKTKIEEFTEETVKKYFADLKADIFPWVMEACAHPLDLYALQLDRDFDLRCFLDDNEDFASRDYPFDRFKQVLDYLREKPEGYHAGKFYLDNALFHTNYKEGEINEGNIAEVFYHTKKAMLREFLRETRSRIKKFFTSYFRFIEDKDYSHGYYFAHQHAEEILPVIGDVLQMPVQEVKKRFMSGEVKLYQEDEVITEYNTGLDYERALMNRI
jgi:hypothetical protein